MLPDAHGRYLPDQGVRTGWIKKREEQKEKWNEKVLVHGLALYW